MEEAWNFFLEHRRSVKWEPSAVLKNRYICRASDGRRLTGLGKRLKGYWNETKSKPKSKNAPLESSCERVGEAHGTLVHSQVEFLVHQLDAGEPWSKQVDKCALRAMRRLHIENMVPCLSEVGCSVADVGTFVDLVVWDVRREELAVVELKTGYEDCEYWEYGGRTMRWPLSNVADSLYMRHSLQADAGRWMLEHEGLPVRAAYVLRTLPRKCGTEWLKAPRFSALSLVLCDASGEPSTSTSRTSARTSSGKARKKRRLE